MCNNRLFSGNQQYFNKLRRKELPPICKLGAFYKNLKKCMVLVLAIGL